MRALHRKVAWTAIVLAAGCGEIDSVQQAHAPLVAVAGGGDAADHGCQIILRELARVPDRSGYLVECVDGACWFVWQGTLDVADAAIAAGADPAVVFQAGSDPTWWQVGATAVDGGPAGFQRFSVRIFEHTVSPGMSLTSLMRTHIEVAPFLALAGGGRLFDHNRNAGDFDNYVLESANAWSITADAAVCPAAASSATVSLQTAQVATRVIYPVTMHTTLRGLVRTAGGGPASAVTVHYRIHEGRRLARDWSTVAARALPGGLWEFETPAFEGPCPHYCPRHVFQFAIEYDVGGVTLWDNNGGIGVDYRLANDFGSSVPGDWPAPAILDQPVRLTYAYWDRAQRTLEGEILLANLAYAKQVDVVYTTDGWASVREAPARFSRLTRDDQEYWQFRVPVADVGEEIRLAVRYRVAGQTMWDNYVGADYRVPTPTP